MGVRVEEAAERKGEEAEGEEVRGRCWVRRAAMREDVKSWTCVRISRPIIQKLVLFFFFNWWSIIFFFSFFFFLKKGRKRKKRKKKKSRLGSFRPTHLVSIHLAESYSMQPITRQSHTQHLPQ